MTWTFAPPGKPPRRGTVGARPFGRAMLQQKHLTQRSIGQGTAERGKTCLEGSGGGAPGRHWMFWFSDFHEVRELDNWVQSATILSVEWKKQGL